MNLSIAAQAVTMTSSELLNIVNSARESGGEKAIRNSDFLVKVADELEGDYYGKTVVQNLNSTQTLVFELTLEQCMLVSMRESKSVRRTVIEKLKELEPSAPNQFSIPQTLSGALRLAAEQAEQIERQSEQLAIAAPKVAFVDSYVEATGLMGFRQVAKLLSAKEHELSRFLEDERIMYRLGGRLTPYAQHIDAQRFEMKTGTGDNVRAYMEARWTPKGVEWLAGQWAKHKINKGV